MFFPAILLVLVMAQSEGGPAVEQAVPPAASTPSVPASPVPSTPSAAGPASTPGPNAPPVPPSGADALVNMLGLVLPLGIIFWLLIWRPESKRRKQQESLLNSIKVKDRVVTVGGLVGRVMELEKDEVVLLVDARKDVRMTFRRSAIASIEGNPDGGDDKK